MGGVSNTVKQVVSNPTKAIAQGVGKGFGAVATGGLSLLAPDSAAGRIGNTVGDVLTGTTAQLPGYGPTAPGGFLNPHAPGTGTLAPGQGSPFILDPTQVAGDAAAINNLGQTQSTALTGLGNNQFNAANALAQSQYDQSTGAIAGDAAARSAARDALTKNLTQQAMDSFKQTLPQTAEDYNAGGLLNSSGYGNEVARQQANLASGIANQVAQVGINDINTDSARSAAALSGLHGAQTGNQSNLFGSQAGALNTSNSYGQAGLGRQLSLEDFINSANVAKAIGAQTAPTVPSAKTGALSGGALGANAGSKFGAPGAALGGLGGLILGGSPGKGK